ncbi:MAG: hypothetical protein JWR80_5927 [Bradyrhizobium sp.]|nr:hypothetical protein [Bradyrhizobium sp.]
MLSKAPDAVAAVHESASDAVDGSSTGTSVPWMWALLRLPRFRGASHADDNDKADIEKLRAPSGYGLVSSLFAGRISTAERFSAIYLLRPNIFATWQRPFVKRRGFRYGSFASILACPQHGRLRVISEMPVVRFCRLEASVWTCVIQAPKRGLEKSLKTSPAGAEMGNRVPLSQPMKPR